MFSSIPPISGIPLRFKELFFCGGARFLISCYRIFAFGKDVLSLQHFHKRFWVLGWMHLFQMWLTPKSSSLLVTGTLCPNRSVSNAYLRGTQSGSLETMPKAATGTWSWRWK